MKHVRVHVKDANGVRDYATVVAHSERRTGELSRLANIVPHGDSPAAGLDPRHLNLRFLGPEDDSEVEEALIVLEAKKIYKLPFTVVAKEEIDV